MDAADKFELYECAVLKCQWHERQVPCEPQHKVISDGLDVGDLSFEFANEVEPTAVFMEAVFGAALAVHLGFTARVDTQIAQQRQD
jgi:hypothetical protein